MVDRLEKLVEGVREMARIDAQLSTEARGPVDIAGLLESIVRGRQLIEGRHVQLDRPSAPLLVNGSLERFSQVFENLVENAVSFSTGEQPVEIQAAIDGDRCTVRVLDRGPGIPEEHLEKIFDRFFSYRPASDRRGHMGLGLAIVKAIVTGYGGTIVARNREGGGAVFVVSLPAQGLGSTTQVQ